MATDRDETSEREREALRGHRRILPNGRAGSGTRAERAPRSPPRPGGRPGRVLRGAGLLPSHHRAPPRDLPGVERRWGRELRAPPFTGANPDRWRGCPRPRSRAPDPGVACRPPRRARVTLNSATTSCSRRSPRGGMGVVYKARQRRPQPRRRPEDDPRRRGSPPAEDVAAVPQRGRGGRRPRPPEHRARSTRSASTRGSATSA